MQGSVARCVNYGRIFIDSFTRWVLLMVGPLFITFHKDVKHSFISFTDVDRFSFFFTHRDVCSGVTRGGLPRMTPSRGDTR